ncbi:MAG: hypothetical protein QOD57_3392, partial [Actinomycetota bacterium]|nr:hypothetical protein [Actinomycetota bacterium]
MNTELGVQWRIFLALAGFIALYAAI